MDIAGTKFPAELKLTKTDDLTKNGEILTIDVMVKGQKVESERYRSTPEGFFVLEVAGEKYEPAIQLIKYGMRAGDTWQWQGQTRAGDVPHKATADVTTASETLHIGGAPNHDVIRVDVGLKIESGTNEPALRKLSFWFVKDKGIAKRAFGNVVREPLVEE